MNLQSFLETLGYKSSAHDIALPYIKSWDMWYRGKVKGFHDYKIYNGIKYINRERYSLNLPKYICEKMSDLLFNEKVTINLGDDNSTDTLNSILINNNFHICMNRAIEKSFAIGTGCIIVDIDNISITPTNKLIYDNSKIKLSYVDAINMYPLSWDNSGIKELAIIQYETISNGQTKCVIKLYILNDTNNYVIKNYQFLVDNNGNFSEYKDAPIYVCEFDTKSPLKWFFPISPNIENNIIPNSPYGISIFANSIDVLKSSDIIFDSSVNEIQLGRKRLFTTKEVLKFNAQTGSYDFNFDPNDIVFHVLGDAFQDGDSAKNYIQEVNGQLRVDEHVKSLNTNLKLLCAKMGLGSDYLTFDNKTLAPKTATEVISEHSELFRTIRKHEQVLDKIVRDIILTISYIGQLTGNYYIDTSTINICFDDSVIESKDADRNNDRQDLAQNTLSRAEYIMKWRNVDKNTAFKKIAEIDSEKEANETIHFVEGEIN